MCRVCAIVVHICDLARTFLSQLAPAAHSQWPFTEPAAVADSAAAAAGGDAEDGRPPQSDRNTSTAAASTRNGSAHPNAGGDATAWATSAEVFTAVLQEWKNSECISERGFRSMQGKVKWPLLHAHRLVMAAAERSLRPRFGGGGAEAAGSSSKRGPDRGRCYTPRECMTEAWNTAVFHTLVYVNGNAS